MFRRSLALAICMAVAGPALAQQAPPLQQPPDMAPPAAGSTPPPSAQQEAMASGRPSQQAQQSVPADFTALARPLLPAVVNISTERTITQPRAGIPGLPFPFGPPSGGQQAPEQPETRHGTALGSGFIIDPTGYVVTNNHVVEGAEQITVVLHDERRFEATLVGADDRTDVALLKIETSEKLPSVPWGDSDKVAVGEWILAIGNPFGLGGTVTSGIISATARNIGAGPYDAFLQTDAPINQGNSGGPMFNMRGEVIGINTAIFSTTGGNIGIGFAVPSSLALPVVQQLRETGTVRRGWLGVQIQVVNPEIAGALGLDQPQGALVADVIPGSPAAEAGLQVGDVILSYQGNTLDEAHRLPLMVARTPIGEKAELSVLRDGKKQKVAVSVAELQAEPQQASAQEQAGELGLALAPLTDSLRSQLGVPQGTGGAVVQSVRSGSPAAQRGVRPGDVITRVGGQTVENPQEVAQQVAEAKGAGRSSVLALIRRGENQQFVTLPLPRDRQNEQVGQHK